MTPSGGRGRHSMGLGEHDEQSDIDEEGEEAAPHDLEEVEERRDEAQRERRVAGQIHHRTRGAPPGMCCQNSNVTSMKAICVSVRSPSPHAKARVRPRQLQPGVATMRAASSGRPKLLEAAHTM